MTDGLSRVRDVLSSPEDVDLTDDLAAEAARRQADGTGADDDWMPESAGDWDDGDGAAPPRTPGDEEDEERVARAASEPLNDIGNGHRVIVHFGHDLMWVPRVGWFTWQGAVWRKDPDMIAVRGFAHRMGPLIERETRYIEPPPSKRDLVASKEAIEDRISELSKIKAKDRSEAQEKELRAAEKDAQAIADILGAVQDKIGQRLRHAKNAGNSGPIGNMITEAGIGLAVALEEIDRDPMQVNTESGVLQFAVSSEMINGKSVRVSKVECLPHDRVHRLTKIMPVRYDPQAECPAFDRFLEEIQPDPDMRSFLQRWFGLAMTGITVQRLAFFYGMGANGKSVLVDLIARILGDYAAQAKIESLTGTNRRGGGDATPDLVPMIGARFLRTSEPDEGMRWQEGLIKELTGGEPILVRALHSDFITVLPIFKLTISGNHKPDIRGTDDGIWRRLMLVPFEQQIPKERQIPKDELDAKLFAERDGIAAWMVRGLLEYLEYGLMEPKKVLLATQEFREESDPYGAFLNEACVVTGDPSDRMLARDLTNGFHLWLAERAEGAFQDRTVSKALKERSARWISRTGQRFTWAKSNGQAMYDGIRFTDLFKWRLNDAPKDLKGRPLASRAEAEA